MSQANIPVPESKNSADPIAQFERFVEIVTILRKHCPWDAKQTNESIAHYMVEEVYECISDIYDKNDAGFAKELGDLLLHIIMHAVMAEERGAFNLNDVITKISDKMIYRHPHVFANTEVADSQEVLQNWEKLKMKEGRDSILDGVPVSLPQLLRAERIQEKVSRMGFDWEDKRDVWNKVEEEIAELKHEIDSGDKEKARMELGDVFFALVNAARHEGLVAEEALQFTNNKFTKRFQYIERKVLGMGKNMQDMSLEELDAIWDEAKREEKKKEIIINERRKETP
jgi:XTP/dITP diphosphohydrolase